MPKAPPSGLTVREKAFVMHYFALPPSQRTYSAAAKLAGIKSWNREGSKTAAKPRVRAALDAELARLNTKLETTAEATLAEIARLAMFDPASLIGVKSPADIAKLPEDLRRAIVGWKWNAQGVFMIELAKKDALEMLAKHHGLYAKDNAQKGVLTLKKSVADMSDEELAEIARGSSKPHA